MIEDLVSVVIPVFNRATALREAVSSATSQTHKSVEVIVINDGSTDDTGSICDELEKTGDGLVRVVHRENEGPGAAREAGRLLARGEFIQYLDSDDLLYERKFEKQVRALREAPAAGIAYCWTRLRQADGALFDEPWKGSGETRTTMLPWFLLERWWDTPNPLYRRAVVEAAGPWLPLWQEEDWEYDVRIAAMGTRLAHVPEFLVEVRQLPEGGLSRGGLSDGRKLASRCAAHAAIYAHGIRAGIGPGTPTMARFSRELFHVARQAGAMGLVSQSRELFVLAREAAGPSRSRGFDFEIYRAVSSLLGWRAAGIAASWADRLRRGTVS